MKISTVEQMRDMDARAIAEYGIPDRILMENAGLAVFEVIRRRLGPIAGKRFVVCCGLGNNGGDGLVVARKLHSNGGAVTVVILGDPARYKGASAANLDLVEKASIAVRVKPKNAVLRAELAEAHCVVDALFGTGLTRPVGGAYKEAVECINGAHCPVVSVDIPSGVDGNTGAVWGVAVSADHTVTFGLPKLGNLLYPGYGLGGALYVTHISFPPAIHQDPALAVEINRPPPLAPREPDGHKGTFGDVLFVAGAGAYYGAPTFAALSCLRAGGGYCRLATPRSIVAQVASLAPEVVFLPQQETETGSLAAANLETLLHWGDKVDLAVVGPGVSLAPETQNLVLKLISALSCPLMVDGDGLTAAAADLEAVRSRGRETVLTPHPGEMARLCHCSVAEIKKDPVGLLVRTCSDLGCHIVLKGAHSLVGTPAGRVYVNPTGNSAMATAGSGDVLCGTIAAMFGLGLGWEDSVRAGVFVHGLAGDKAAATLGADGVTARDIAAALPAAVREYRQNHFALMEDCYHTVRVI